MTDEQSVVIQCISDFIHKKRTNPIGGIDWATVKEYARQQQIEGIVSYQLKTTQEICELKTASALSAYNFVNRKKIEAEVHDCLIKNNIPHIFIKGSDICDLYPVPALRSMGDVDILIHKEDREIINDIFLSLGFILDQKEVAENGNWHYIKNGIEIEIHVQLLHPSVENEEQVTFFSRVWENCNSEKLEINFHLIYLLAHIREHLMDSGVGLRQFMDLAVVVQQTEINWSLIKDYLESTCLIQFARVCFSICSKWFGTETELSCTLSDEFFDEVTEKIFVGGVFGFNDQDTNLNRNIYKLSRQKSKFNYIIYTLFPNYKNMCKLEQYKYIRTIPFLLPVAWAHRIINKVIIGKWKESVDVALLPYIKKNELKDREDYLKAWGL